MIAQGAFSIFQVNRWSYGTMGFQYASKQLASCGHHWTTWRVSHVIEPLLILFILCVSYSCIIVDSTRRGKRIPDSLSKTIPIWCSTFNRAIAKHRSLPWDTSFHSLPTAVSRSEHAQIEARIDEFAQRLLVLYNIHTERDE